MEIRLTLPADRLERFLRQFLPVRIHFGSAGAEDRWIELFDPHEVSLVEQRGLRVRTSGRLRYSIAGFTLPWSINALDVLLEPRFDHHGEKRRLAFHLAIERAEFANVPALLQKQILPVINNALNPERLRMVVPIEKFLTHAFDMPALLEPLDQFQMGLEEPRVEVEPTALQLTLPLRLDMTRQPEDGLP